MKKLLPLLCVFLACASLAQAQRVIAVDPAALPPAFTAGDQIDRLFVNKDTYQLLTASAGGGGGGGGSTTFSTPQSFRLSDGTAWKDFTFGSGTVNSGTLRVTLATDGPGVSNLSTIATNTAVQFGSGVVTGTTQRVTLATDGAAVTNLATIAARTPVLGQATMANSSPVTIASDQSTLPIQPARGLVLAATQVTSGNGVLNYDILSGTVSGWYDAQDYFGRMVALTLQTSAGTSGGNLAFEQTDDLTLDPNGGGWNLQDKTVVTTSSGASLTVAASTTYRRIGYITSRYIRLRLTSALTAGTLDARTVFSATPYTPLSLSVTQSSGSALNAQVIGNAAEDAATTGNPVTTAAQAYNALPANTIVNGDTVRLRSSFSGQLITKPYATRDLDFQVFTTVVNNTQTAIRAAQAAGIRQNVTSVTYQNTNATATTLTIQDGATTIFQISAPASMANPVQLTFPQPLFGTAATALNYTAGTTGANVLLLVTGFNSY